MLDRDDIKKVFDDSLVELSSLVVRNTLDRTDDGVIEEAPELQFQVTNISGKSLVNLDIEANYYSSTSEFVGTDSDLRLEPLKPGEVQTFSLFVDPPKTTVSAELKVNVRSQTFTDRIPSSVQTIFLVLVLVALVYSKVNET